MAGDADRLASFSCSTGRDFEDEVESWIRFNAQEWLTDGPRAAFQRRELALVVVGKQPVAVVAWQDIIRVDIQGVWLEVLAVSLGSQRSGMGRDVYRLLVEHLATIDRDGDHLAGLVHEENHRSKRLLGEFGWAGVAPMDDYELWVGSL